MENVAPKMANEPKLRTVIVDDIPELLHCVMTRMEKSGVIDVVGTASNGLEALQLATALKPDLVLMDVNMPIMDGLAAVREIKRAMPRVRVVLMSAENSPTMRDNASLAGADRFIPKSEVLLGTCLVLQMLAA